MASLTTLGKNFYQPTGEQTVYTGFSLEDDTFMLPTLLYQLKGSLH